jgi:hypothetical protein
MLELGSAHDRRRHRRVADQPGQRDLGGRHAARGGERADRLEDGGVTRIVIEVTGERIALRTRRVTLLRGLGARQ